MLGALLSLGWATPTPAATALSGDLELDGINYQFIREGVLTVDDVVITHGGETRITASHAKYTRHPGDARDLELTGKVHIEFRGALLDADTALLKFRGEDLQSIAVKGSQAQFSHQPEGYSRRVNGRADAIAYDAASNDVRFSGNTWWTTGREEANSNVVVYNIVTGTAKDDGDPSTRGQFKIRLGESTDRVPPPRQPDRSTAE
jgi:lipopolysaccharide transport protein LptA